MRSYFYSERVCSVSIGNALLMCGYVEATSDEFVCERNSDEKFGPLVAKHKGIFCNVEGMD